jgi:hypothetical protein
MTEALREGPMLVAVYDDNRDCIGHILLHGEEDSVEAFAASTLWLGTYRDTDSAVTAVWRHAHGQQWVDWPPADCGRPQ